MPFRRLRFPLFAGLLALLGSAGASAFDLVPQPFSWVRNGIEQYHLLFPWAKDQYFVFEMRPGWKFQAMGGTDLKMVPKEQAEMRLQVAPLDGLPPDFTAKESQTFYASQVMTKIPQGAQDIGPLKRSGPFCDPNVGGSDSYGLLYTIHGSRRALAMGFVTFKEQDFQMRYVVDAKVEDFEELHEIARAIGRKTVMKKSTVDGIRSGRIIYD